MIVEISEKLLQWIFRNTFLIKLCNHQEDAASVDSRILRVSHKSEIISENPVYQNMVSVSYIKFYT